MEQGPAWKADSSSDVLWNPKFHLPYEVPGYRREVDENCCLLGYYAASSAEILPTFRDNLTVPSSEGQ